MNNAQARAFGPDIIKQLRAEVAALITKRDNIRAQLRDSFRNKGIVLRDLRYVKEDLRYATVALHTVLLNAGITRAPIPQSLARYQNI